MRRPPGGSDREDGALVRRVLAGERDAYRLLVRKHQQELFRVAWAMVADRDVADDLVQDAFVRAYENLARCKDPERFRFWLLTTLRNRALDHIKEKRRRDLSLADEEVLRRVERAAPAAPDPGERLGAERTLLSALEQLSPPLREAFVLRHVEEHSFEEVAKLLGTGVSAVKMRVHRARLQLQAWLAEEEGEGAAVEGAGGEARRAGASGAGVTGRGAGSSQS